MMKDNNSRLSRVGKLLLKLTDPPVEITDIQQKRQVRLLSYLLWIIIPLGSASAIIQLLTAPNFLPTFLAIAGAIAVMLIAYALTLLNRYRFAATIISLIPSVACYALLVTNAKDPSTFGFLLISVLLSSILLNRRYTVGIAVLNLIGLFILPLLQPAWTYSIMGGIISYQIIIPALIIIATWNRDLLEQDRQEKLRNSEERFSLLFNSTSDLQMMLSIGEDRNFYIEAVNQSYLNGIRRFKPDLTEQDLIGRNRAEIQREAAHVSPQELEARDRLFWQAINSRAPVRIEDVISSPQGRIYIDVLIVPIIESDGSCQHVFWSARDITERKQAELALRESEMKFRSIFDNSVDAIGVSKAGVHVMVNPAYLKMFGYESADQLVGNSIVDLIAPADRPRILENIRRRAAGQGIPNIYETRGLRRDGTEFDIEVHVATYELMGELFTVPILRDISERKKKEEQIRYQASLLENVSDAIIATDLNFKIISWNQAAETLYGWSASEVIGKPVGEILQTEYPVQSAEEVRQKFIEQGFWKGEVIQKHKDGTQIDILSSVSSVLDENRQQTGVVAVNRDISERKQAEEKIRQSEERFREMAENIQEIFYLSDLDSSSMLYISPAYETIWGRSCQSLYENPTSFMEAVHPEDRDRVLAYLERQRRIDHAEEEYRVIQPDGAIRWVWDRSFPLRDPKGYTLRMCGVVQDITERKRIEDALRENEAIFSSFLDHSPVYVFFKDKDIRSLRLSRNYEQMLGMPLHDLLGKTMDDLFPSDLAKSMVADDQRILNEGRRIDVVEELNGRIYETTKFPVLKDGQPYILAGFTLDITERRRAEEKLRLSEERYRTLAQNLPDSALLLFDRDLRFFIADGPEINASGFSRELEGKTLNEALPPEYAQLVESNMRRVLAGEVFYVELPYEDRFYHYSYVPIRDRSGEVNLAMILATNITERKHMEDVLYEEKERAEITLHSIGDAVITTDTNTTVQYLNPVAENLTGWKLEEAVGRPLETVFHIIDEGSRQPAKDPVERSVREGRVVGLANHTILIRRDGVEFAINDSAAPIRARSGEVTGVVLVFHDVTEERRLSRQVAHDAMHDSLTGLVNRREFEKRLERALINTKEHHVSHILCYLDLDQFKIVNDTAGHAAGDELLKQISGLLGGLFRQRDTLARLGGDEFGLLLENCQLNQALIISSEIKAKIRDFPFVWAGHGFQVGVSIGVVPITADKESVNQLLSQADIACYSAKDLGRDRIHVYQAEDSETTQRHSEIIQAARMRDAIFHDQFQLFCQPIVQVSGEKSEMPHHEVLLRMADDEAHLVLPSAFIPSAERYGLMPAIDRWVIRETLLIMARHDIKGMLININLSGNSLDDETLLEYVLEQLDEFSIPPDHICFEITETAAIHHLSKAQQFIHAFRGRGGKIALDDFGSGFSSFRYLKTLPVDFIKIDGSFVSDMLSNPGDLLMVEAITRIAHTLGIQVIAEHAINPKTISRLQEIGVDRAQGFGIAHPVPLEEVWRSRKHGR